MSESSSSNGWRRFRFDEMATIVNDRVDDPSQANVDHYVGLEHLDSDSLRIRRWGSPADVKATKLRFRRGDIIFGRRRVYQRKLGVAHFNGICSAHAMVLRAKPNVVLPEFLPFFMQTDHFMERAREISVGSLSPTINWEALAKEEFPLPRIEEQRRIANVLSLANEAIETLYRTRQRMQEVQRSHLNSFFAPRFKQGKPLTKVAHVLAGSTPLTTDSTFWNGDRPWASGKDLKTRHLTDTQDMLTEAGWAVATVAPKGATLIVVRGMILAHTFPVAQCKREIAFNQDLRALVAGDELLPEYLFLWTEWASRWFLKRTASSSHGTKRIDGRVFDLALVPVLSHAEQECFIKNHRALIRGDIAVELRIENHDVLRKAFVAQVFEGAH
jgi:type I restriction enzyme S subunit